MNDNNINAVSGDDGPPQHFVRQVEKSRPGASQKRIIQFTGGTSSDNARDENSNFKRIEEKKLTTEGSVAGIDTPEVGIVNETGNSVVGQTPPENLTTIP